MTHFALLVSLLLVSSLTLAAEPVAIKSRRELFVDDALGVEAVVSRDHGQTWDLDHRYLLHTWVGNRKGPNQNQAGPQAWWASSQATSTVLLPDGNLLTAFGTVYRSQPNVQRMSSPRDVGLIQWRLNDNPVRPDRRIRDAAPDSDLRNWLDPSTGERTVQSK